jgi:nucleoside-diphosphate-sugar epimerase
VLVLLTGANGFIGRILCDVLSRDGCVLRTALRRDCPVPFAAENVPVGDICATTDWSAALRGVECVIHLAARAHVMRDPRSSSLYMETNAHGTRCLAEAAARAGVRRLVFLSTVKVNGEEAAGGTYTAMDDPHPMDAYGTSKWLAETAVFEVAARTGMEATVVRAPLVYGPGVRANFLRLLRWVDRQLPLPLATIENRRSLVSVWNLCDLLRHLLRCPEAAGRLWMVSDGEDLSTPALVRRIGHAMDRRVRLFAVPASFLRSCGRLLGREAEIARLCGSLTVDIAPTRSELVWQPPLSVDAALARTVAWYLSEGRSHGS